MQITKQSLKRPNFTPDEFFVSTTAKKLKINNYPSPGQELGILTALMSTADMMQQLYNLFFDEIVRREGLILKPGEKIVGFYVEINSAYRCLELNRAVGSKDNSQHPQGLACDFICPGFGTPEEIVKFLHSKKVIVDQCFNEGTWVHISRNIGPKPNRMMYGYYLPDKNGIRKFKKL